MADDKKIIFSMVGVSKTYPPQKQVLKNIYLSFFYGAKIGIIGLNGSGKSSLLKIIAGIDKDYQGEVVFSPGYSVGYLEQDPQLDPSKTVIEVVREGVQPIIALMQHSATRKCLKTPTRWMPFLLVKPSFKINLMPPTLGISIQNSNAQWTLFNAHPTTNRAAHYQGVSVVA